MWSKYVFFKINFINKKSFIYNKWIILTPLFLRIFVNIVLEGIFIYLFNDSPSLNESLINRKYLALIDSQKLDGSRTFMKVLWWECRLVRHRYLEETVDQIQGAKLEHQMSTNDSVRVSRKTIIRRAIIEEIICLLRTMSKKRNNNNVCAVLTFPEPLELHKRIPAAWILYSLSSCSCCPWIFLQKAKE